MDIYRIKNAGLYFLGDHWERLGRDQEGWKDRLDEHFVKEGKGWTDVEMSEDQALSLISDALYYMDGSDWDEHLRDLRRSAKSVTTSLDRYFEDEEVKEGEGE